MYNTGRRKCGNINWIFKKEHFVNAHRKHRALPVKQILWLLFSFASGKLRTFQNNTLPPHGSDGQYIIFKWHVSNRHACCGMASLFLPPFFSHFLSVFLESRQGWLQLGSWKVNSKCQSHTHRMSNTHSSPWCGGTLINSIPDLPMSRSIDLKKTGTRCPPPTRAPYPKYWAHREAAAHYKG